MKERIGGRVAWVYSRDTWRHRLDDSFAFSLPFRRAVWCALLIVASVLVLEVRS